MRTSPPLRGFKKRNRDSGLGIDEPKASSPHGRVRLLTYAALLTGMLIAYLAISFGDLPRSGYLEQAPTFGFGVSVDKLDTKLVKLIKGPDFTVYTPYSRHVPYDGLIEATFAKPVRPIKGWLVFALPVGTLTEWPNHEWITEDATKLKPSQVLRSRRNTVVVAPFRLKKAETFSLPVYFDSRHLVYHRRWGETKFWFASYYVDSKAQLDCNDLEGNCRSTALQNLKPLGRLGSGKARIGLRVKLYQHESFDRLDPQPAQKDASTAMWSRTFTARSNPDWVEGSGYIVDEGIRFWVSKVDGVLVLLVGGLVGLLLERIFELRARTKRSQNSRPLLPSG
jgi:hypothetical protein